MDLIDREKLKSTIQAMVEIPNEVRVKVLGAISRETAVDAVPVVRCKDCKTSCYDAMVGGYWCNGNRVKADHFCSYGKRKDT